MDNDYAQSDYWIEMSEYDMETADAMLSTGRLLKEFVEWVKEN
jgi:hypothetical protein